MVVPVQRKQRVDKMGHSRHGHGSWSKLPRKIIHNICKHLQTPEQMVRFKRVCRRWKKHSILLPANILSFTLPLSTLISTPLPFHSSTNPLVLQVSSIYLITPSQSSQLSPWMIMVQESNPGKLRLRHPLTAKRVHHFPPTLDLSMFRAHELAQGYNFKHSDCVHKVLLCTSTSSSSLQVLVLFLEGILGKLTVRLPQSPTQDQKMKGDEEEEEQEQYCWKKLKVRAKGQCWFHYLDDVIEFKGKYCATDRKGRLYELDMEAMMVANVLTSQQICRGDIPTLRRKRLVVDHHPTSSSSSLYLVERKRLKVKTSFEVYRFNEECKRWDAVQHLGSERVLFVGVDHCFFAKAKDFPGCTGNCIVFSANCFTQYVGCNAPDKSLFGDDNAQVGVYQFGKGSNFSLLSSACPKFSKLMWPPPTWFSLKSECKDQETDSSSCSQQDSDGGSSSSIQCLSDHHAEGMLTDSSGESSSDPDEDHDEAILLDSSSSKPSKASTTNEITNSDEDDEEVQKSPSDEQTGDFEANAAAPPSPVENVVGASEMEHEKTEEGAGQDFSKERVYNENATPVTPSAKLPSFSPAKFQGVDIKAELLPTLETIWSKRGNLIGEETVRTKDMRACALESLAKLVITLQNTTGKNLTETRAEEIKSSLFDLQRAGLKVEWLVPAVEKATNLQKNKQVMESVERLNKRKAQVDEEEKEFLARTTKVKQEIEEEIACLSAAGIPFPEVIDLDDCLGRGLY